MIYMLISGSFFLSLENFLITIALGFAFLGIFSNASGYINNFNEFVVSEKGIRVRIFNFWFTWKEIAWNDILWMKECQFADYERDKHWIIAIKRMTIWHKKRGKELGYKGVPVIEFNSNLKDIDAFISLMRKNYRTLKQPRKAFHLSSLRDAEHAGQYHPLHLRAGDQVRCLICQWQSRLGRISVQLLMHNRKLISVCVDSAPACLYNQFANISTPCQPGSRV